MCPGASSAPAHRADARQVVGGRGMFASKLVPWEASSWPRSLGAFPCWALFPSNHGVLSNNNSTRGWSRYHV